MNLEEVESYKRIDTSDMLSVLMKFPEDIWQAYTTSKEIKIPSEVRIGSINISYGAPNGIIICGMGGSAIGGDLLKCLLIDRSPLHVEVVRDYKLPAYASRDTLVIVVSYSGNTEEALSCFIDSIKRGCMSVAITSGGMLMDYARRLGIPIYEAPRGRAPRAAIAYLFLPLLGVLKRLGFNLVTDNEVKESVSVLRELREEIRPEVASEKNIAKDLAMKINGLIPVIYAYRQYRAVAFRFKTQLNENSKYPAKVEELPELDHNEVVGWEIDGDITKRFLAIVLKGGDEPQEIQVRFNITIELIKDKVADVLELKARGNGRLARMLSLLYVCDFTSYYLALLNDIDPTPVRSIELLKKRLSDYGVALKRIKEDYKSLLFNY